MTYYDDLKAARKDAEAEFLYQREEYLLLIEAICGLLPECALSIEQTDKANLYLKFLLASFVRTSYVAIELIVRSELIEAVTLNRKQLELLARLYELDKKKYDSVKGATPQIKHIRTKIKKQYGSYSEGAHSSTFGSMSLLGFYKDKERKRHMLFPEFTENTEIIFAHWVTLFFEFTLWYIDFKTKHLAGYSRMDDEARFFEVFALYQKSGLRERFGDRGPDAGEITGQSKR